METNTRMQGDGAPANPSTAMIDRPNVLDGTSPPVADHLTDLQEDAVTALIGRNKGLPKYKLSNANHPNRDIPEIRESDLSQFDKRLSAIYPLTSSPLLTKLRHIPPMDSLDPVILSYQMALSSLGLLVGSGDKERSLKYRKSSSKMLASVHPKDSLLACVIYILLV